MILIIVLLNMHVMLFIILARDTETDGRIRLIILIIGTNDANVILVNFCNIIG